MQQFLRTVFLLSAVSVLGCSATVFEQKAWRKCGGYASHNRWVSGTDTSYVSGWAKSKPTSQNALLDNSVIDANGTNPTAIKAALQTACDALLAFDEIGEVLMMGYSPDHGCNGKPCVRMAIYKASDPDKPHMIPVSPPTKEWVCTKGQAVAPEEDCAAATVNQWWTTVITTTTTTVTTTIAPSTEVSGTVQPFAAHALVVFSALAAAIM